MSNLGKIEQARYDGAKWLLKYAEEHGLAEARKEMERRGNVDAPLNIDAKEVAKFGERLKENMFRTFCAMSILVLRDEFEFGKKRAGQFYERFQSKAEALDEDFFNWNDVEQILKDELDIEIVIADSCKR